MTHICVSKLTSVGSYNGLSPDRHQAIFWINTGILFSGPMGTNFSETLIESYGNWRPFCLGLNVLISFRILPYIMKTSSNWNISHGDPRGPVNSPHKGPVTRSFDIFFDLRLNKRLRKQSWGWWFETLSCPFWRQCNVISFRILPYVYRMQHM